MARGPRKTIEEKITEKEVLKASGLTPDDAADILQEHLEQLGEETA